ncbi:coniferyl aldehyde dehydrogenase [Colwellia demingiae]|uniref:Aldehyde dehydrogenase n=1 Tax=Colwellia demingiae TaxID=89401 RepID=A0A5C6QG96_9GAMM|nr:coniferyl aldehyde dehydrogenase [Colwellia demingiae]TWX68066.1 coniferyl aldehyde dehydrogenase [Colwellia demingiae]
MNSVLENIAVNTEETSYFQQVFTKQKEAAQNCTYINLDNRLVSLNKLEKILLNNQDAIAQAINKDFGNRAVQETLVSEIFGLLGGIKHSRKKLKQWMKPQKRHVGIAFFGAKNTVVAQAKGVIGVISPWNYPLFLALSPCISAIAAGNRCIVKMASNSQTLCHLLSKLIAEVFDDEVFAIIPGVSASEFTAQAWDHIVFTGSPEVGKKVMTSAAKHLTPVTLELGGKSPAIVADDFDIKEAAERILFAKYLNAGQTCVAPDYLFVPRSKVDQFVDLAKDIIKRRYPSIESKDFTSIIDDKAFNRLQTTLQDAVDKGAKAVNLCETGELNTQTRKIPPYIVINTSEDMLIMQDEIFGPLLPIKPYDDLDEVIGYINKNERPLALYIYSNKTQIQQEFINNTLSGGICINDSMLHVAQHDMPFGGIGNSGMGHYHGQEGFNEFSKLRPIFKQAKKSAGLALAPPYGEKFEKLTKAILKWKLY